MPAELLKRKLKAELELADQQLNDLRRRREILSRVIEGLEALQLYEITPNLRLNHGNRIHMVRSNPQ